jgi:hypothetical protein
MYRYMEEVRQLVVTGHITQVAEAMLDALS